jgi:hypothetical protein
LQAHFVGSASQAIRQQRPGACSGFMKSNLQPGLIALCAKPCLFWFWDSRRKRDKQSKAQDSDMPCPGRNEKAILVRIVVADDHKSLSACAIQAMLEKVPGLNVVGEAADGREAIRLAGELYLVQLWSRLQHWGYVLRELRIQRACRPYRIFISVAIRSLERAIVDLQKT